MGMTTLLTVTAMFGSVRQNVPRSKNQIYIYAIVISLKPCSSFCTTASITMTRVSYMTQLDVWMVTCIFIVFLCIFEFVVASTLIKAGKKVLLKSFPPFQKVSTWSYYNVIVIVLNVDNKITDALQEI